MQLAKIINFSRNYAVLILIVLLMIGILFFDVAIQIFLSVNGLTIFDSHITINNLDYIGLISQLIGVSVSINFVYNLKHI